MPYEHVPKPDALEGVTLFDEPIPGERFEIPEDEREGAVLGAAIDALQYARWGKWEPYYQEHENLPFDDEDARDIQAHLDSINYQNYEAAMNSLVNRFGEEFFTEVAWVKMRDHLQGLHCKDNDSLTPYKAHADINPYTKPWINTALAITEGDHPLPERMMHSVANIMPLYGDTDFWKFARNNYPAMFANLTDRFLGQPDEITVRGSAHGMSTVHPRALLEQHFPETYRLLVTEYRGFIAPLGSVAVRPHLGKRFGGTL